MVLEGGSSFLPEKHHKSEKVTEVSGRTCEDRSGEEVWGKVGDGKARGKREVRGHGKVRGQIEVEERSLEVKGKSQGSQGGPNMLSPGAGFIQVPLDFLLL